MDRSHDLRDAYLRWLEGLSVGAFSAPTHFAWIGEGASLVGSAPEEWFTGAATAAAWEALLRAFDGAGPPQARLVTRAWRLTAARLCGPVHMTDVLCGKIFFPSLGMWGRGRL